MEKNSENNLKNALRMFQKDESFVEIGGVPFERSADIVIVAVGDDYLVAHQKLAGKERDFIVPFSAVKFVTAKT